MDNIFTVSEARRLCGVERASMERICEMYLGAVPMWKAVRLCWLQCASMECSVPVGNAFWLPEVCFVPLWSGMGLFEK